MFVLIWSCVLWTAEIHTSHAKEVNGFLAMQNEQHKICLQLGEKKNLFLHISRVWKKSWDTLFGMTTVDVENAYIDLL